MTTIRPTPTPNPQKEPMDPHDERFDRSFNKSLHTSLMKRLEKQMGKEKLGEMLEKQKELRAAILNPTVRNPDPETDIKRKIVAQVMRNAVELQKQKEKQIAKFQEMDTVSPPTVTNSDVTLSSCTD